MRNLRKFNTRADYESATLIYPAVSLIVEGNTVAFDPEAPAPSFGGLTVYYDIDSQAIQNEIALFNGGGDSSSSSDSESGGGGALPATMIVDGVEETPINTWRFETAGEHIVQYTFENNEIPQSFLDGISVAKEVVVGTDIVGIGSVAFNVKLTSATCLSTTPPYIGDVSTFGSDQHYPIYVPSSAVNTYKTASIWTSLASRIQAKS